MQPSEESKTKEPIMQAVTEQTSFVFSGQEVQNEAY